MLSFRVYLTCTKFPISQPDHFQGLHHSVTQNTHKIMDLIAMAAVLLQQSSRVETRIDFQTHSIGQEFICKNYLAESTVRREAELLPSGDFLCTRADGRTWNVSQSDIVSGLRDDSYRPCIFTGGMRYERNQTAEFCIGDL